MSALTDPIADFLTRIRNAVNTRKTECVAPLSKIKQDILVILKKEGYIENFEVDQSGDHPALKVTLRYSGKTPAITGLRRVSRPGLRRYVQSADIPAVLGGLGVAIVSTSQGVMSGHEARHKKIGGELLAYVW